MSNETENDAVYFADGTLSSGSGSDWAACRTTARCSVSTTRPTPPWIPIRHLLFLFLYNTGARVSEALSVRVQEVQRDDYRAVQLLGKGRKQRTVPLWKETAHHIRAWLKLAGLKPDQPLLPNRFGRTMTRTAVQQRLQLHVRIAQLNCPSLRRRRISPHTIRHATAMSLLQSGVAAPVIALWLGHEDPTTTHQYIEADLLMKEQALRRLQPPKERHTRFKPRADLLTFLDSL